jgi:hypothetical protein
MVFTPKGPIVYWPSWRYGPDGQAAVFNSEDDVPEGWADHPAKVGVETANGVVPQGLSREPAPRRRPMALKRTTQVDNS